MCFFFTVVYFKRAFFPLNTCFLVKEYLIFDYEHIQSILPVAIKRWYLDTNEEARCRPLFGDSSIVAICLKQSLFSMILQGY